MGKTSIENARASRRKHYHNNKGPYIARSLAMKQKLREFVDSKKNKCMICEETEKVCLDFHHLVDKSDNVGSMINKGSLRKIKEEIEKCVVLCANCHRKVHAGLLTINMGIG